MGMLSLASALVSTGSDNPGTLGGTTRFRADHKVLAQLGKEHLAHAVWRRVRRSGCVVAWGDRVLEWPITSRGVQREVFPAVGSWKYSNGGCAMDIDGDGADEIVVARADAKSGYETELVWFRERPGKPVWEEHIAATLGKGPGVPLHDIHPVRFSVNGETIRGVVLNIDRREMLWYRVPDNPAALWERHVITTCSGLQQSGMAIGDVAGNGRPDVVTGQLWAECPADPLHQPWKVRQYGNWEDGGWGGMNQIALGDMDGDGRLEIVATEAEIPNARLGIFRRDRTRPDSLWICREIEQGLYCPHSLVIADLDADGRLDLVVGEMTAGGWDFPMRPEPKLYAYLNRGDFSFERIVLAKGWGVHEMGISPTRQKGKAQVFAADEIQPHKFPDMTTHVSLWNITISR